MKRERDEEILEMIALRCDGWLSKEIAEKMGTTASNVRDKTGKVRVADALESGEDVDDLYW